MINFKWKLVSFHESIKLLQGKELLENQPDILAWQRNEPRYCNMPNRIMTEEVVSAFFTDGTALLTQSRWDKTYYGDFGEQDAKPPAFYYGEKE